VPELKNGIEILLAAWVNPVLKTRIAAQVRQKNSDGWCRNDLADGLV
jgi:hypothetical protein